MRGKNCCRSTKRKASGKFKDLKAKKIRTRKIVPTCTNSTIGTADKKFKKIYAKELFVDLDTINFGNAISLSTSPNGTFYCTVNGVTKVFKYETNEDFTGPQGPQGPRGIQGLQGPIGLQGDAAPLQIGDNDSLLTETIRDIPSHGLSPLFFNSNTNEISFDSNAPSYSDLIEMINTLQQEVADLKAST